MKDSFPKLPTVWLQYWCLPRSLQKTLNDLKDYQKKHDFWQHQNEKLLAEQVPANIKINQHVAHESLKMQQANTEIGWFVCLCQILHTICCLVIFLYFSCKYAAVYYVHSKACQIRLLCNPSHFASVDFHSHWAITWSDTLSILTQNLFLFQFMLD